MNKYTLILCFLIIVACPKIDPPDDKKEIELTQSSLSLSLESQWTTSLKIKATVRDTADTFTFELLRDDSTVGIYTIENTPRDTILTDGPLTPSTEYQYHAFVLDGDIRTEYSDTLSAMTMDTTSHNFTWEIDTLGGYGSYLNDVWIVNENDIWVVGNIVTDSMEYNMAHWDGVEWELMGLVSQDEQIGDPGIDPIIENYSSNIVDLDAIHYFSDDDIWVCSGFPKHWDGNNWTLYHLQNMGFDGVSINTMWGTSSSNLYFTGANGSIVHYDGTEFVKMESGTDLNLVDISGTSDGEHIFVTGFNNEGALGGHSIALSYNGEWTTLREEDHFYPVNGSDEFGLISAVWCTTDTVYFMTYSGLRTYSIITNEERLKINRYSMGASDRHIIKFIGNSLNDIIFVGSFGHLIHFNGLSWSQMFGLNIQYPNGQLSIWGMDYNENLVVAVGDLFDYEKAVIVKGKRE